MEGAVRLTGRIGEATFPKRSMKPTQAFTFYFLQFYLCGYAPNASLPTTVSNFGSLFLPLPVRG